MPLFHNQYLYACCCNWINPTRHKGEETLQNKILNLRMYQRVALLAKHDHDFCQIRPCILQDWLPRARSCLLGFICYVNMASRRQRSGTVIFISLDAPLQAIKGVLVTPSTTELPHIQIHNCLVICKASVLFKKWNTKLSLISHDLNFQQGSYILSGQLSRYSDSLRTGWYGERIPMEARLPAPVQTGNVALPASYTMGTGSLLGIKRTGCGVNHPTYIALRLKKEYSYTSTPAPCLHGGGNLPFFAREVLMKCLIHFYSL
jgi:hypothetical protein